MPHFAQKLPYKKQNKYPHLLPEDTAIWERWIESHPDVFSSVQYDVHIGIEEDIDEAIEESIRGAWFDLTRWKIDVLAEDEAALYIIEIKPFANSKALGQALAYSLLYESEHQPVKPIIPVVLTNSHIKTTRRAGELMGVRVWVI